METLRAKMVVSTITHDEYGNDTTKLRAVMGNDVEENKVFSKFTPQADLTIVVNNPDAKEFFKVGQAYYLDFTSAEPKE